MGVLEGFFQFVVFHIIILLPIKKCYYIIILVIVTIICPSVCWGWFLF